MNTIIPLSVYIIIINHISLICSNGSLQVQLHGVSVEASSENSKLDLQNKQMKFENQKVPLEAAEKDNEDFDK